MTSDPPSAGEPLPPWLRDASIEPDDDAAGADATPQPSSPTAALRDLIARTPNRPAPGGDAEVPIWLQNLLNTPDDAPATGDAEAADDVLPHDAAGAAAPTGERGASAPDDTGGAPAIPGATRPLERRSAGVVTDLPIVEAGPVDPAILASIVTPALTGGRYTPVQVQAIERLRAITTRSAAAAPPEAAAEPPRPWRLGVEHVLSAVVLLLVIAAAAVPALAAPFRDTAPTGAALLASDAIAALEPGDVVLLAYEWDARRTAELAPIERAMLDHLAERGVGLVLFSSDPQGVLPQLAAQDQLARSPSGGGTLLALGYQPGGSAALALLARAFGQVVDAAAPDAVTNGRMPLRDGAPVDAITDLSAIIVFADDLADVQGWMEQVYPTAARAAPPVPLTLVVTADASLPAAPYARQPGVTLLAGPAAAASYHATRSTTGGDGQLPALRIITLGLGVLLASMALTASIATAMRRRSAP